MLNSRYILLALVALYITALCVEATAGSSDKMAKYNARVGKKYLDENSKKDGVTTLPSGLQYKVLTKGNGKKSPSSTDQVKVHYKGTLINGKEFDSR